MFQAGVLNVGVEDLVECSQSSAIGAVDGRIGNKFPFFFRQDGQTLADIGQQMRVTAGRHVFVKTDGRAQGSIVLSLAHLAVDNLHSVAEGYHF